MIDPVKNMQILIDRVAIIIGIQSVLTRRSGDEQMNSWHT